MASKNRETLETELADDVKSSLLPLQEQMDQLSAVPEVVKYLEIAKQFRDKEKAIKLTVQDQMEKHGIKSIKGSWGYMTIAERSNYKAADLEKVQPRFTKRVLDTTRVGAYVKLHKKLPAGVESNPTRSLTISLKPRGEQE